MMKSSPLVLAEGKRLIHTCINNDNACNDNEMAVGDNYIILDKLYEQGS